MVMSVDKGGISALREIGLTVNQARVYACLLTRGTCTAKQVSEDAEIGASAVYSLFADLVELGLIRQAGSKPITYTPIPPAVALRRFWAEKAIEINLSFKRALESLDVHNDLISMAWGGEVLIFEKELTALTFLFDLIKRTKEDLLGVLSGKSQGLFRRLLPALSLVTERRTLVRLVLPEFSWIGELGEGRAPNLSIRVSHSNTSGFMAEEEWVFVISPPDRGPIAVYSTEGPLFEPIASFLQTKWMLSMPIDPLLRSGK